MLLSSATSENLKDQKKNKNKNKNKIAWRENLEGIVTDLDSGMDFQTQNIGSLLEVIESSLADKI